MNGSQIRLVTHNFLGFRSLWTKEGQASLQALIHTIDSVRSKTEERLVLLINAQHSMHDASTEFLEELQSELLRHAFLKRVKQFQSCVEKIRRFEGITIFMSEVAIQGAAWDLALSCDYRIFSGANDVVGFPELEGGFVAPGGPLLSKLSRGFKRLHGNLAQNEVMTVVEARRASLIDEIVEANRFQLFLEMNLDNLQKRTSFEGSEFFKETEGPQDESASELDRPAGSEKTQQSAFSFVAQHLKNSGGKVTSSWFAQFLPERLAVQVFTEKYQAWLAQSLHSFSDSVTQKHCLYICVDQLAPPVACLTKLLDLGHSIIFIAKFEEELEQAMEVIYARLDRHLGHKSLRSQWDGQIQWVTGEIPVTSSGYCLEFLVDDVCAVKELPNGQVHSFYRLSGNRGSASAGCVECSTTNTRRHPISNAHQIVSSAICDNLILTPGFESLPVSLVIRSMILLEMTRVCRARKIDFYLMLDALSNDGWGFISDEQKWEHFLRFRPNMPSSVSVIFGKQSALGLDELSISSLRELTNFDESEKDQDSIWLDSGFFTQHIQRFCAHMLMSLSKCMDGLDIHQLELLLKEAVGWPKELSSPTGVVNLLGDHGLQGYAALHWLCSTPES